MTFTHIKMLFIKNDNALRLDLIWVEGFDNVQLINLNLNSNVLEVNIKTKKDIIPE